MQGLKDILVRGAEQIGVLLPDQVVESYLFYIEELKKWNKRINLTALTGDLEIGVKHFVDSLTAAPYLQGARRVLDIGAGAGFPGLPLKILSPSIELLLLESSQKKVFFLRSIVRGLTLEGVEIAYGRAQDREIIARYTRSFDLVLSRALADLPTSLQLALPYVRKGGLILGMRGKRGEEEQGETNWGQWGLQLIEMRKLTLPFVEEQRVLLLFQLSET
ncbi:MAG: 16S rRNA (guanine(527)-N(7))-methyltransferase RsmG [Deltaproteobacteria bacterium RBG_13_52_11]|nr:MAG: 16S rRNA (guanine(527)-N(7))-methyltransferase RsmG [Deltaproteobacteria bacterium RBG_13_52_11]